MMVLKWNPIIKQTELKLNLNNAISEFNLHIAGSSFSSCHCHSFHLNFCLNFKLFSLFINFIYCFPIEWKWKQSIITSFLNRKFSSYHIHFLFEQKKIERKNQAHTTKKQANDTNEKEYKIRDRKEKWNAYTFWMIEIFDWEEYIISHCARWYLVCFTIVKLKQA